MTEPALRLSILLLSEDASQHAYATLGALVKRMSLLLEPSCQTHRIGFEPPSDSAARAVHGNVWKSNNPRDHRRRIDLVRTIATKLTEPGSSSFVFFHVDGDRTWGDEGSCENRRKFDDMIIHAVERCLVERAVSQPDRDAALTRLILVMPFWSIEAWLYQNTCTAIRLCRERYSGADVPRFEAWERDRASLDEEVQPKEQTCLRDRHNLDLATDGFPAKEVYEAGASFTAVVDSLLLGAPDLLRALGKTYA